MRPRSAPSPGSLWGKQPLAPEQPQHSFPAHLDAVLTAQPGADLALALPGVWRGHQDLADQLEQVGVADRGRRARAGSRLGMATGIDGGTGHTEHPAHHRHWQLVLVLAQAKMAVHAQH